MIVQAALPQHDENLGDKGKAPLESTQTCYQSVTVVVVAVVVGEVAKATVEAALAEAAVEPLAAAGVVVVENTPRS
eukprot:jgi/Tetstr1/426064/TSEL_016395.t1